MSSDPVSGEQVPNPPAIQRARPGLSGLSLKALLCLVLSALLPFGAMAFVVWSVAGTVGSLSDQASKTIDSLWQADQQATKINEELRQRTENAEHALADTARETALQAALKELAARLDPLVTGKSNEDISADAAVKTVLEGATSFPDVALFDPGARRLLLTHSGKTGGPIDHVLPELGQAWAPDRPSPAFAAPGWHWVSLKASGLALAVLPPPPPPSAVPAKEAGPLADPAPVIASLDQQRSKLGGTVITTTVLVGLVTLAMALLAFWWMRQQVLAPLRRISKSSRELLDRPGEVPDQAFGPPGLLSDLADTQVRIQERLKRLKEQDAAEIRRQDEFRQIVAILDRSSSGVLTSRVEVTAGDQAELALAINRLLDSASERLQGMRRAGGQLQATSDRLHTLAQALSEKLSASSGQNPPIDPGPLAEVVGVQLEGLLQLASGGSAEVERSLPVRWTPEQQTELEQLLGAATAGFEVLQQRAEEVVSSRQSVQAIGREAQLLSTNLAVVAQTQARSQLEPLVEAARKLSTSQSVHIEEFNQILDRLQRAGELALQNGKELQSRCSQCLGALRAWEHARDRLGRERDELRRQVEVLRPGAKTLANDIHRMVQGLGVQLQREDEKRESLKLVAETSAAVSHLAGELLGQLSRVETDREAPTAAAPVLVERQRQLEKAIEDLAEAARGQGIESLAADTTAILKHIQEVTEQARSRLLAQVEHPAAAESIHKTEPSE